MQSRSREAAVAGRTGPAGQRPDSSHARAAAVRARGSAMIELALYLSVGLPLLLGATGIGLRLGRSIEAAQVTRDVGHMYALGADFSLAGTQQIASTLAGSFNLTSTGNAVLIFSKVMKVAQVDCTAAGLTNCPNLDQPVFTQRLVLGNSSLRVSNFGTPAASYLGTQGVITAANYCKQASLVASGFESVLSLGEDQIAWMVEGYYSTPDLNLLGAGSTGGIYVRMLF
jgi:hypothetical protein